MSSDSVNKMADSIIDTIKSELKAYTASYVQNYFKSIRLESGQVAPGAIIGPKIPDGSIYTRKFNQADFESAVNTLTSDIRADIALKQLKTYTSVTQLELTDGSATIATAASTLPDSSIYLGASSEFSSSEVPDVYGLVEIKRNVYNKLSIMFYGRTGDVFTQYCDSSGVPTGVWTTFIDQSNLADLVYPVGSIYLSVSATSPATLFGGTWVQIEDRFLLAAGSTYTAGGTGGESTHVLTVAELPPHNFTIPNSKLGGTGTTQWVIDGSSGNTVTSSTVGSGTAHNNMPPYLAVYVWERTA